MALRTSTDLTNETVKTITKFQNGELRAISTGIEHLDYSLLGGLLPGTVLGIVARASHGKSFDAERIQRHILDNEKDVVYVKCAWELSAFKILLRDISQRTKRNIKQILFDKPTEEQIKELKNVCDIHRRDNVFYQNEPVSPEVFSEDIESIINKYPDSRIVVEIDNLENVLITKGDQKSSMDALLYQVNRLKNLHPFVAFIVLNQMNQNYILRMDNPKNQRPLESDCYGSDQLLKLCDVLYIKIIPWKLHLRDKFMIFGKDFYPWLEDFKIYPNDKTASFDPFGTSYYFYLKLRAVEDEKNIKDIFAERMFTRDETTLPIESPINNISSIPIPDFNTTAESPIKPIYDMTQSFDIPAKKDDSPF